MPTGEGFTPTNDIPALLRSQAAVQEHVLTIRVPASAVDRENFQRFVVGALQDQPQHHLEEAAKTFWAAVVQQMKVSL